MQIYICETNLNLPLQKNYYQSWILIKAKTKADIILETTTTVFADRLIFQGWLYLRKAFDASCLD